MSLYSSRLDDLMTLLRGRAIEPAAAVNSVWDLQDQRRDNRMARRQAAQEALSGLTANVTAAAAEGTTLDSLVRQYGGPEALAPAAGELSQLYTPGGYSMVAPTLDAEDEGAISNMVFGMLANRTAPGANPDARTDLGTIRQNVMTRLARSIPQADLKHLIPAIDEVVTRSYSSAVRSPSSGYLDQLLTAPPG